MVNLSHAVCLRSVGSRSNVQDQIFSAQSHSHLGDFVNAIADWCVSLPPGVVCCNFISDCLCYQMRSPRVALGQDEAVLWLVSLILCLSICIPALIYRRQKWLNPSVSLKGNTGFQQLYLLSHTPLSQFILLFVVGKDKARVNTALKKNPRLPESAQQIPRCVQSALVLFSNFRC